jgi:hypothetical protein
MIPCSGCGRLVRAERECPFCGRSLRVSPAPLLTALIGFAVGCGPAVGSSTGGTNEGSGDGGSTSVATTGSDTTSADGVDTTSANPSTTMQGQTETGDDANTTSVSVGFIYGDPSTGGVPIECSVWDQDCGKGEKCTPWANDGGEVHNATRCVPVDPEPAAVGEPCVVEGSFVSGIDTCELGGLCTPLDADSLEGVCTEVCSGSVSNPTCDDTQDSTCMVLSEVLPLCGATCNPVDDTCPDGGACQSVDFVLGCVPPGDAEVGDPCFEPNGCIDGALCVDSDALCREGADTCCAQVCDLAAPDPDSNCSEGRTCVDFFPPGDAPPAYENVGVCRAP